MLAPTHPPRAQPCTLQGGDQNPPGTPSLGAKVFYPLPFSVMSPQGQFYPSSDPHTKDLVSCSFRRTRCLLWAPRSFPAASETHPQWQRGSRGEGTQLSRFAVPEPQQCHAGR